MIRVSKYFLLGILVLVSYINFCNGDVDVTHCDSDFIDIGLMKGTISSKVNQFSTNFYKRLANKNQDNNLVCSPLSVNLVMAMLSYGATDTTRAEIRSALQLPDGNMFSVIGYQALTASLNDVKDVWITLLNKLFINESRPIYRPYEETLEYFFRSEIQNIDFTRSNAAKTINHWTRKKTKNAIDNMITPDDLEDAKMILVNTLYFRGWWKHTFEYGSTRDMNFYVKGIETSQTKTMVARNIRINYNTLKYMDASCIELPYATTSDSNNYSTSMYVILPNEKNGLKTIEDNLDQLDFETLPGNETRVNVYLPSFEVKNHSDVSEILKEMGIKEVFQPNASLGYISRKQLQVRYIKQKVTIKVNEFGIDMIMFNHVSPLDKNPSEAFDFIVDRPFLCVIVLKSSGTPLFYVRVTDPRPTGIEPMESWADYEFDDQSGIANRFN